MKYDVHITRLAQKALSRIPSPHHDRLSEAIEKLALNPRPVQSKKLKGREAWRIRVGDYRVIYEINDQVLTILIVAVGHRGGIYKMLK